MKRIAAVLAAALFSTTWAVAGTDTWTGSTNGNWSVSTNWLGNVAPVANDSLSFGFFPGVGYIFPGNANALNNDFPANTAFYSLGFAYPYTAFSASGSTINLGAGGLGLRSASSLSDSIPLVLTSNQTWNVYAPGHLILTSPASLDLGTNTLTISGSGRHAFDNTISGSGGITLMAVTLFTDGTMSYTGTTTVGGQAELDLSTASPIATPIVVNSGGVLFDYPNTPAFMNAPLAINAGGTYAVGFDGTGQCSKVIVNAAPTTLGGNLSAPTSSTLPVGTVYTIIQNQTGSAVVGTFAGLPEGATFNGNPTPFQFSFNNFRISYQGGSGHDVTLTVIAPPTISKVFGASSIPLNGSTSLSFTIANPNSGTTLTGIGFTDALPVGLVVSTPNGLSGNCNGTSPTATAGSTSITLSGASLAGSGNCTFSVSVTGIAAGVQNNATGNVSSTEGGTGLTASASVVVTVSRADLNADGKSDVLWQDSTTGASVAWLMNGTSIQTGALLPMVNDLNWKMSGSGDFNGDGKWDAIWVNGATGQVVIWLMNGASASSAATVTTLKSTNWKLGGVGDFNRDGKADVIWRNVVTGEVVVWLMNGTTISSTASLPTITDLNWNIVGVGDFDGDGKADVFWRNESTGEDAVWLMNGTSVSSATLTNAVPDLNWVVAGVGDLDGDGKSDVVWWNQATGDVAVWLMNAATIGSAAVVGTESDVNWHLAGVGDFDGDGNADLIWLKATTGDTAVWLMNGTMIKRTAFITTVDSTSWSIVAPR